jgi:hypothetical protein
LGSDKGCCPCSLEVETSCHAIDVEHFTREEKALAVTALHGGGMDARQ